MLWTKVEVGTRRIVSAGQTAGPPTVGPRHRVILGVRGDAKTQRSTVGYDGLEPRMPLAITTDPSPPTIGTGEALRLTASEPFLLVGPDGDPIGDVPEEGTVAFDEEGEQTITCYPTAANTTALPVEIPVTVTAGGTPEAADLRVGERRATIWRAVEQRLADFDTAVARAEARRDAAEEIRTRTITTQAQAVAAIRDLAAEVRNTNADLASAFRHLKADIRGLVEIIRRRMS